MWLEDRACTLLLTYLVPVPSPYRTPPPNHTPTHHSHLVQIVIYLEFSLLLHLSSSNIHTRDNFIQSIAEPTVVSLSPRIVTCSRRHTLVSRRIPRITESKHLENPSTDLEDRRIIGRESFHTVIDTLQRHQKRNTPHLQQSPPIRHIRGVKHSQPSFTYVLRAIHHNTARIPTFNPLQQVQNLRKHPHKHTQDAGPKQLRVSTPTSPTNAPTELLRQQPIRSATNSSQPTRTTDTSRASILEIRLQLPQPEVARQLRWRAKSRYAGESEREGSEEIEHEG